MADDQGPGEKKASGLKTFLWAAAAATALAVLTGGIGTGVALFSIKGALLAGATGYAASKAWQSHKENQAINAENASWRDGDPSGAALRQQERALAIARMQDDDQSPSSRWAAAEAQRRAVSQNVR